MGPRSRITQRWRFGGLFLAVGWQILRRPGLWSESLRQARAVTSGPYRAFRSVTAYGDPRRLPAARDVLAWLRWSRSFRRLCARRT